jgi:hypothetical protein
MQHGHENLKLTSGIIIGLLSRLKLRQRLFVPEQTATNIYVRIRVMYRLTSTQWQKPCVTSHVAGIVLETNKYV